MGGVVARRSQTMTPSKAGRTYPSVKLDRPPAPPAGMAIEFRSAQLALWHRIRRSGRRFAVTVACFVITILLAVFAPDNGFVAFLGFAVIATGLVYLLITIGGLVRTARIYRLMHRHPWTVYRYDGLRMRENLPVRVTLIDPKTKTEYPVKFHNSKRAETLRGMVHKEIWYVGDPSHRGLLTVAGGGEMFRTRPDPVRPYKPPKQRKPTKPRKVKPIDPAKARRDAARAAAQRAKWAEQAKKRIAKQRAKPPKPVRQPRLPKIRGAQKIKWK
ncbi:MAG TPA: hypothetical protein VGF84_12760 [Micromonosporaceae bacterium]